MTPIDITIASPLCIRDHCQRKGRCTLGPPTHPSPDCENRDLHCLTCGATGVQSRNLTLRTKP